MARPLGINYPGAVYHVTARGNARQPIVVEEADRHRFVATLAAMVAQAYRVGTADLARRTPRPSEAGQVALNAARRIAAKSLKEVEARFGLVSWL